MEDDELSLGEGGMDRVLHIIHRIAIMDNYKVTDEERILLIIYYHSATLKKLNTSLTKQDLEYLDFSLQMVRLALGDTTEMDKRILERLSDDA